MSNLLLITDVARLRKIFGRLTEDKNIRLRIVNNLERGGEEIAIEKPDVVFVQTHLSGLSADILIMHLKKQLGRKRSRFVLLASPGQVNDAVLKPYQGWLDTSAEDGKILSELKFLLAILLNKPKKSVESETPPRATATADATPQPVSCAESSALLGHTTVSETVVPQQVDVRLQFPVAAPIVPEPSLEEQGVTYAPRQRLTVYSEFNSSFDNAVSNTQEPEPLQQTPPTLVHDWDDEAIDTIESKPLRSKRVTFLLWMIPVVIVVVAITYLQQQKPDVKPETASIKKAPTAVVKPVMPTPPPVISVAEPVKAPATDGPAPPGVAHDQDRMNEAALLKAIGDNRSVKSPPPPSSSGERLTTLPRFIPRYAKDKQYSATNPGWERYKGQVIEFKVLHEGQTIKAIQVVDLGGGGLTEAFLRSALRQVTKNPVLKSELSEKKDGYDVERGKIAENIKAVFYRDENGGQLRAFVLTWQ